MIPKEVAAIKGQHLRIFAGSSTANLKCIAAAQSCTAHVSMMIENASTKSDEDLWTRNEVVGMAWDLQAEAIIVTSDAAVIASGLVIGHAYTVMFSQTTGSQNRTPTANSLQLTGTAILTDLELTAQHDETATYRAQFTGTGDLTRHT